MAESTSTEKLSRIPGWVKKVGPVLVSGIILYYCFQGQDWEKLMDACARANLWLAILAIVIPQLVYWYLDALMVERTFNWFHGPFPFWPYFWVKGAIYILMFVNTIIGSGGMLLYQQRKADITWNKYMGILLFRLAMAMWGIAVLMIPLTLAMHYYGLTDKTKINMYVWWGFIIFGVLWMTEAWIGWHGKKHFGLSKIVVRDRETEFWTAFQLSTRRHWLLSWAMILPPYALMLVGFYFCSLAFDVKVPFLLFMAIAPLALLIMGLPIAFAGFGTATVAWMMFFNDYGREEDILALSLFLPFARMACRALIGMISLQPALGEINALFQKTGSEAGQTGLPAKTGED
jgi:hypothetical protein